MSETRRPTRGDVVRVLERRMALRVQPIDTGPNAKWSDPADYDVRVTSRLRRHEGEVRVFLTESRADMDAHTVRLPKPDATGHTWRYTDEWLSESYLRSRAMANVLTEEGFDARVAVLEHEPASGGESFVAVVDPDYWTRTR